MLVEFEISQLYHNREKKYGVQYIVDIGKVFMSHTIDLTMLKQEQESMLEGTNSESDPGIRFYLQSLILKLYPDHLATEYAFPIVRSASPGGGIGCMSLEMASRETQELADLSVHGIDGVRGRLGRLDLSFESFLFFFCSIFPFD